jgi:excisionase family DNA binding protein
VPDQDPLSNPYVRVSEAAKFLGLSRASLYNIMDSGALKYAKFGASRRISIEALREYAERCTIGA